MPAVSQNPPEEFRAQIWTFALIAAVMSIACWARWAHHRNDLADEVENRFVALFAVILTPLSICTLLMAARGDPRLVLSDESFTIRTLFSKKTYYWSDGYEFELRSHAGIRTIAFHRRGSDEVETLDHSHYNISAEELIDTLRRRSKGGANGS
jgi:hypothetical protein